MTLPAKDRVHGLVKHIFEGERPPCLRRVGVTAGERPLKIVLVVGRATTEAEMDAVTTLLADLYSHLDPGTAEDEIIREDMDESPRGDVEWLVG